MPKQLTFEQAQQIANKIFRDNRNGKESKPDEAVKPPVDPNSSTNEKSITSTAKTTEEPTRKATGARKRKTTTKTDQDKK